MLLLSSPGSVLADESADPPPFQTYYGTAASASSYGGYGGNANKKDSAEYIFAVPQVWVSWVTFLGFGLRKRLGRGKFVAEKLAVSTIGRVWTSHWN